jgi:DNA replication and repair protein RecF
VRLAWIEARDFRNHRETSLEVPPGLTAVVGPNGQGKTNLLEAMYYLFALESPRVRSDLPLVRDGAASAFLRGEILTEAGKYLVEVEVRPSGANRVQVNRSVVRRRRDLRTSVRSVFSGPDDLAIVGGEPDARRRFMDEALKALWPLRESVLSAYERTLRQRNRLLKDHEGTGEPAELAAWDEELIAKGSAVTTARAEAIGRVGPPASEEFASLVGERTEVLRVAYQPSVPGEPLDPTGLAAAYRARLLERRPDELVRRTSLVGPHRDELGLAVQGLTARGFASHGESWGAALALRLGMARALRDEAGEPPVTFLDDPFSPFDPERRGRLVRSLPGRGQLLIAVPDEAQVPPDAVVWRAKDGMILPA